MKEIIVNYIEEPMRLDRYLRTIDPSLSQGLIEKALRQGDIRIKGIKIKSSQRIERGDIISIKNYFKINEQHPLKQHFSEGIISLASKITTSYKLYENEHILAINKPSGLATQGGSKINLSIDHALQYLNTQGYELRLVHRLDRETSGVLLLAKTRRTATIIGDALENRTISKKYIAITSGDLKEQAGHIRSYLAKIHDLIYEVKSDHADAKLAETSYKVLSSEDGINLIEFMPHTGRMHQIRCHAAYSLKTPIIGDKKYGSEITNAHLFLHASNIKIPSELFGKEIIVTAEVPGHFKKFTG